MALITFSDICFKSDGDYKSYDEMVQGALDDDCYQKVYPGIASQILLENLIQFVQDINNKPANDGVVHGTLYRKANGRQIDSSRRYYLVKESNLDEYNLYAKITKGRNLGFYRIYTNKAEVEILMKYDLNYMKREGNLPSVADCLQYAQDSKYLIARERCEFVSRLLNNNVAAARYSSTMDYDVTKLGTRQQQTQKCSKETASVPTVTSSTSTPIRQPCAQKQVLSSSTANNNTSRSPSHVAEHSQSPPLKRQKNNNRKLIKKQQQEQLPKTTAEQPASTSSESLTPILKRLRIRPDDHTAAASSTSNSTSEPVLATAKSKIKQTARIKKRGHPSQNE